MLSAIITRLVRRLKSSPGIYFPMLGLRPKLGILAAGEGTGLVIEGFPRCGNTFAVVAFELAQEQSVKIAHHLHVPAQIIYAVRHHIPVLVLIRNPVDAVISYMIRDRRITIEDGLNEYIWFYSYVLKYRDQVVLAEFESVTGNYGDVIMRLNERFHTRFSLFEHTAENEAEVFRAIEGYSQKIQSGEAGVARPSESRAEQKKELMEKIMLPEYKVLRERAGSLYHRLVNG